MSEAEMASVAAFLREDKADARRVAKANPGLR